MNKLDMESKNIVNENIQKISELFPNVIVESNDGKTIDFDLLKQELSKDIVEGVKEKYQLTWPGKKEAIVNANTPSKSALRPVKEKSIDFDNTQNIYIEGDNLEVLKILQESYLNKIKCIYIDPPYNTGNDFIYNDKFKKDIDEELLESGQVDEEGNRMVTNNQSNGRFHSDWLSMMYPRLKLARNLLTDDGVIFISIDNNEIDNLLKISEEIFNKRNIEIFIWKKKGGAGNTEKIIGVLTEYIVCCFKNKKPGSFNYQKINRGYSYSDETGKYNLVSIEKTNLGTYERKTMQFEIVDPQTKKKFLPGENMRWTLGYEKIQNLINENKLFFDYKNKKVKLIKREEDYEASENVYYNLFENEGTLSTAKKSLELLFGNKEILDTPKPLELLKKILQISSKENTIILDFFSGSATTEHAVMQLNSEDNGNRKFIMVQLPEKCDENSEAYRNGYKTICEIGEERIRRAGKKIKEETNADIDYGVRVYKVDSTNMKDVYYMPNDLQQGDLLELESNIKEDRTTDDLLTQVILDLGLSLDLSIEEKMIGKNRVYYVAGNSLVACFDDKIDINIVDKICECEPYKVVFKDSAFKTDNDKINLEERFKKLLPQRANDSGFINIL